MTAIPLTVNARWIATLADDQLVAAEAQLYGDFHEREVAEKSRCGPRYMLLQGPSALVDAWQRWLMVSNEARARGVIIRRTR